MIPDPQAREKPKSPKAHGCFLSNEVGRKKWLLPEQLTICEADRSGNLDRKDSTEAVGRKSDWTAFKREWKENN